jgi:hypothetical protein
MELKACQVGGGQNLFCGRMICLHDTVPSRSQLSHGRWIPKGCDGKQQWVAFILGANVASSCMPLDFAG